MRNEESRLKRDDPLTAIMAQTDSSEDFWVVVTFQLSLPIFLRANRRNTRRVKAGISSVSLLLMQNPECSTAVMIHPRTPILRRAIEHQKARERKVIFLSHHILMLMWKLETASRSRSASIRKNMCQESSSDSEVEADEDSRRHPKKEHRKKKREEEIAPSSFSKDKEYKENKRRSRRSRERRNYSDSSSSEREAFNSTKRQAILR